jgi:hypothetical protein
MPTSKKRKQGNHTRTASTTGYGWGVLSSKISKSKRVRGRHQEVVSFNLALLSQDAQSTTPPAWPEWSAISENEKYLRVVPAESVGLDVEIPDEIDKLFAYEVEERGKIVFEFLDGLKRKDPFTVDDEDTGVLNSIPLEFSVEQWESIRDHVALHFARMPKEVKAIKQNLIDNWRPNNQVHFFGEDNAKIRVKLSAVEVAFRLFISNPRNEKNKMDAWNKVLSWKIFEKYTEVRSKISDLGRCTLARRDPGDNAGMISLPTTFINGDDLLILEMDVKALFRHHAISKNVDENFLTAADIDCLFENFIVGSLSNEFLLVFLPERLSPVAPYFADWLARGKIFELASTLHSITTSNNKSFAVGKTKEDIKTYYDVIVRIFPVAELHTLASFQPSPI